MKICPNCKTQNLFDGAQFCKDCGAPLDSAAEQHNTRPDQSADDKLDFVVTESIGTSSPELIGMENPGNPTRNTDDGLEIKSTANLLEDEAAGIPLHDANIVENGPIGDSTPPPPPVADQNPQLSQATAPDKKSSPLKEKSEIRKLSKEEIAHITNYLYQDQEGPETANQRPSRKEIGQTSASEDTTSSPQNSVRPISDPAQAVNIPKTHKVRGVAFFKNNFIQIVGSSNLHTGDELTINDKHYLLRPKKFSKKLTIGLLVGVFAILLFMVGSQFINPTVSGDGEIIGIILDQNHQPFIAGARVTIPALNKITKTNAQGFFRFELVPTGTYDLVYELGDEYVGRSNATVTSGQTTLMTFGNAQPKPRASSSPRTEIEGSGGVSPARQETARTRDNSGSETKTREASGYGNLKLAANIADARLSIDDKILGAGNNTYSRIKAGRHKIKVEKAGYAEYTGTVEVASDQTTSLNVVLNAKSESSGAALTAADYFGQGEAALAANTYQKAVGAYSNALKVSPGYKEAYWKRAEAYGKLNQNEEAADDYIRLGEIYRVAGAHDQAINSFTSALTYSPKNRVALVGRGGAKLDNGDYRPALADFEEALKTDDQFYPALYGCGISQFRLGNNKQADKYFKNAYRINQKDPYLYQYMMLNYLALDDIKNMKKIYTEFKAIAAPTELAEFKSSSRFAPVIRLINEEDR